MVTQAPGPFISSRNCAAPSPCRSILLCVSSTRVVPASSAVKRISISLALVRSMVVSATQSGLSWPGPTCHERHTRSGGSQCSTLPQSQSSPLALRSYQRPPTRGSMKMASNGVLPMWCVAGHQLSICSTNTLQARSIGAFTRMLLKTLRSSSAVFPMPCSLVRVRFAFGFRFEFRFWGRFFCGNLKVGESFVPHLVEVGTQARDTFGIELIEATGSGAAVHHEANLFEHLEVLGDSR